MKPNSTLLATIALAMATGAAAQTLKPGLWEINNKMQSGSGEMEQAMASMEKQMAGMPPQQRKQMQDMLAKQGMGQAEKMNMDTSGKWLSADCGNVKPLAAPKK